MKQKAWEHLPNAAHIDRVLAHLREHPDKWDAAWSAVRNPARFRAWDEAWKATWDEARDVALDVACEACSALIAWDAARNPARNRAWNAARDACCALIAWDEAGELLNQPPAMLKFLANQGAHPAILLYPAVLVMSGGEV
jgi:hypothetical protein